jgi:hypothetical protein
MNEDDFHEGHLKPCSICGGICDSLSPNKKDWPIFTLDVKDIKIWAHGECLADKIQTIANGVHLNMKRGGISD